jgi:hypothetical protein
MSANSTPTITPARDNIKRHIESEFLPRKLVPFDPEFQGIFTLRQLEVAPPSALPFARVGNRVVYRRSDLRAYLATRFDTEPLEIRVASSVAGQVIEALARAGVLGSAAVRGRPRKTGFEVESAT